MFRQAESVIDRPGRDVARRRDTSASYFFYTLNEESGVSATTPLSIWEDDTEMKASVSRWGFSCYG